MVIGHVMGKKHDYAQKLHCFILVYLVYVSAVFVYIEHHKQAK